MKKRFCWLIKPTFVCYNYLSRSYLNFRMRGLGLPDVSPSRIRGYWSNFLIFCKLTWNLSCGKNLVNRGLQRIHQKRRVNFVFQRCLQKNCNCRDFKYDKHIIYYFFFEKTNFRSIAKNLCPKSPGRIYASSHYNTLGKSPDLDSFSDFLEKLEISFRFFGIMYSMFW